MNDHKHTVKEDQAFLESIMEKFPSNDGTQDLSPMSQGQQERLMACFESYGALDLVAELMTEAEALDSKCLPEWCESVYINKRTKEIAERFLKQVNSTQPTGE